MLFFQKKICTYKVWMRGGFIGLKTGLTERIQCSVINLTCRISASTRGSSTPTPPTTSPRQSCATATLCFPILASGCGRRFAFFRSWLFFRGFCRWGIGGFFSRFACAWVRAGWPLGVALCVDQLGHWKCCCGCCSISVLLLQAAGWFIQHTTGILKKG